MSETDTTDCYIYKKLGVWIMGLILQLIMLMDDKIITFLKFSIAQDEHALSIWA